MKKYGLLFFMGLASMIGDISHLHASGNYKKSSMSSPQTPYVPPAPSERSAQSIRASIEKWERGTLTISDVKIDNDKAIITGNFSNRSDLNKFETNLKGEKVSRDVKIKEKSWFFAGKRTYEFEAIVENKW
ncbi:MAG: hypothetical protein COV38_16435 [Bdellovibrionales bacterium CG11_big_fil_rev_8_21_14_0_20_38_13]|nr:MAG: hypothetical protein COV38_16435 [Bdellovibrionales bacterium CG11_big_fil_rev_8_21_14_0_20_38_13]